MTGHRPKDINIPIIDLKNILTDRILKYKPTSLISGMAIGVDILTAQIAIENNIDLVAAIPFVGQEKLWNDNQKYLYNNILKLAKKKVIVCEGEYAAYKMQIRNEYIVDNCDVLIAVHNGKKYGGTYNCIKYAEIKGKNIDTIKI
jgi:uncharacterized phage-like protein YoqJ